MTDRIRLCRSLRWKSWYGSRWDTREQLLEDLLRGDVPYSCLHTCRPWGPDDALAAPEACQPGRACFAPSPREPGSLA
jgi:hypothetical protein